MTITNNLTVLAATANAISVSNTGIVNASAVTVGTAVVANTSGVYTSGTVNAAAHSVGTSFVANSSQVTVSGVPISANGGTGSAGQVLTSNGAAGSPYWASAAAGGFSNMTVFTANGTWTVPAGITKAKTTVVGGGGNSNTTSGGGGGAAIKVVTCLVPGNTVSVTVGLAQGTSSFGSYASATGASGATPGVGSSGALNIKGQGGTSAQGGSAYCPNGCCRVFTVYWPGGSSLLGGGGRVNGNGGLYGGGAGAFSSGSGTGANGVVIIEY